MSGAAEKQTGEQRPQKAENRLNTGSRKMAEKQGNSGKTTCIP